MARHKTRQYPLGIVDLHNISRANHLPELRSGVVVRNIMARSSSGRTQAFHACDTGSNPVRALEVGSTSEDNNYLLEALRECHCHYPLRVDMGIHLVTNVRKTDDKI